MSTRAGFLAGIFSLLLITPVAIGVGVEAPPAQQSTGGLEPAQTQMVIDLTESGNATWAIQYRIRLDDDNTTAAFEDLQADIQNNRSAYVDRFGRRINQTEAAAESRTGRSMRIENITVSTRTQQLPQTFGIVTYRFHWVGFSTTNESHIVAGDALSGLYLDENTRLEVNGPEGYPLAAVDPEPTTKQASEGQVAWDGPQDFGSGLRIVFGTSPKDQGMPLLAILGGLVVLGILIAGGWWYLNRDDQPTPAPTTEQPSPEAEAAPTIDPELMSNEEQVIALLEQQGGRMKQQDVVDKLGWTEAKTSQVVTSMRDDEALEVFRIGRENVLTLPGTGIEGGGDDDA